MPVLKHAKKKLRQDKKRTAANKPVKEAYKKLAKEARSKKSPAALSAAFKAIDKAVKKGIIHQNKAARLKSSLSKLVAPGKGNKQQVTSNKTTKAQKKKPAKTTTRTPKS